MINEVRCLNMLRIKNSRFFFLGLSFFFTTLCAHAEIFSIQSLEQIFPYLTEDTLLVLDVDDTLMKPLGHRGSTDWYQTIWKELQTQGMERIPAALRAAEIWDQEQEVTAVIPLEAQAPENLRNFKGRVLFQMMALTARNSRTHGATFRQLQNVRFDFSDFLPGFSGLKWAQDDQPILFRDGILFAGYYNKKGLTLAAFFQKTGYRPRRVVFADNMISHVQEVTAALEAIGIEVVGFHYQNCVTSVEVGKN